jgi:N-acetyl-anhydromuramyl-L-alanine amidase AmpD
MATYAQRMSANPTRTGAHRGTDGIRWLVIHTSEGGEGLTSAESLAAFIQTPRTSTNLASYHYIFDTDRIIPIVPDAWIAYAAGGGNAQGLHACYPGKAGQTPEQWADSVSSAQHEQAAQWLADKADEYDIPLVKLGADDLRAGKRGVCGHHDVSLAFKKSDHTDPGKAYPWGSMLARANEIAAPPPPTPVPPPSSSGDDDMVTGLWKGPNDPAVFAVCSNRTKVWCYPDTVDEHQKLLVLEGTDETIRVQTSAEMFRAMGPVIGPRPGTVDEYGWR